jgi:N-acetylmuramoyl-L-alanine amidase
LHWNRRFRAAALTLACLLLCVARPALADPTREPIGENAVATLRRGRVLFLECTPPRGKAPAESYLKGLLADPSGAAIYVEKGTVAIPFSKLNPETKRRVLLAIFKQDYVDERGWTHTVLFAGRDQETLWTLSEWLTGRGTNHEAIARVNRLSQTALHVGQQILVPKDMLPEVLRRPTPRPAPPVEEEAVDLFSAGQGLSFVKEGARTYAVYRLQQGEALYTAVVVRFTDFRENDEILEACTQIAAMSGIKDVHAMEPGTPIRIPAEWLSDRFKPEDSPERLAYEAVLLEAERLRGQVRGGAGLEGVVVVLDAGHGGRDYGAHAVNSSFSLYEDEIVYDIVCRVKKILETQTRAKVYVTMRDPSQGYTPGNGSRFSHDSDEEVLVTPPYRNGASGKTNARVSANLRWYLANSIYRKELAAGTDKSNIVFTSIHCDALFNERLRGAMVYIPGARYRRDSERPDPRRTYERYAEVRQQREFRSTAAERRRDEALSRNFASTLLDELGKKRIRRHKEGDPIRNVIRQSGGVEYVPAVLRNTMIPTKVLVETANMTNHTDCTRLADPEWRQWFAEAYVNALKAYYKS